MPRQLLPRCGCPRPPALAVLPACSWDLHGGMDSIITAQADPCRASLLVSAMQPLLRRAVDVQACRGRDASCPASRCECHASAAAIQSSLPMMPR